MYQNETTSFLKDCADATIRLNDQTEAAIIMQECADDGKSNQARRIPWREL